MANNNIVTFCGHQYDVQKVQGWTLFEVGQLQTSLYAKHGQDSGLTEGAWFLARMSALDRKVLFPFLDIICQPVGDSPMISKILTQPEFSADDMTQLVELIRSFSGSVAGSSDKQPVTRKTSSAKGRTKKKAAPTP